MGCFSTKDMQTSPPLRSGHLDIKDAQCAKTKEVLKKPYHIISRFRVMSVKKERYDRPKIKFSSIVAKFAGKIGIDLTLIFRINVFFCASLSY